MNDVFFGIDLGTSTSEIFFKTASGNFEQINNREKGYGNPIFHSLIAVNNKNEIITGEAAYEKIGDPDKCLSEFKRDMGDREKKYNLNGREITPVEASAMVLKMLKQMAKNIHGFDVKRACISIPANFPNNAREDTIKAAKLAEIEEVELINEPTAAAIAYGFDKEDLEEQVMVFDWGGGTLDVTVLEIFQGVLDVVTSYGDPQLGGKDFDQILINFMYEEFSRIYPEAKVEETNKLKSDLKKEAKKIKEKLTFQEEVDVLILNFGQHKGESKNLQTTITRKQFETLSLPILKRAENVIQEALDSKNVKRESIKKIIPVGGTTYMPCVRELLKKYFSIAGEIENSVPPDLAVAKGATINAAIKWGNLSEEKSMVVSDVCPFGLGVPVVRSFGGQVQLVYDSLIETNTKIPYSITKEYSLLHEEQDGIEMELYQSHKKGITDLEQVHNTGIVGNIDNIPRSIDGIPHPVVVNFSYDVSGLIELSAEIPKTGQSMLLHANANNLDISVEEMNKLKEILGEDTENIKTSPDKADTKTGYPEKYIKVISKAKEFIEENPGHEDSETLIDFLEVFEDAHRNNNSSKAERYFDRIKDVLLGL